ncbi:CTD small phosphatase-like protein 3 [Rana temporaria]|uniref:CTD small phosphatase-like protein 3 n=1 Tax=Rana temporaria TaxID=8407 RepID=UPI001AAD0152|nr:CTD small phosphatase-like protein 3 [Rana temporaria]
MILRSRKIQARPPKEPITPKNNCGSRKTLSPQSIKRRQRRVQLKSPEVCQKSFKDDAVTLSCKKNTPRHFYNLRNVYVEEDSPQIQRSVRVHFQLDESSPEEKPIYDSPVVLYSLPISWSDDCTLLGHVEGNLVSVPDHQYFSNIPKGNSGDRFNLYSFMCNAQAASRTLHRRKKDIPFKTRSAPAYTLVIDLDVLVQSSLIPLDDADYTFGTPFQDTFYKVYLKVRPHVKNFLQAVSKLYELFIYTTTRKEYGEQIVEILDPQKTLIRHRLYQDHCMCVSGFYVKDLNVLWRDLAKTVAIQTIAYTLPYHLTNRFPVQHWTGNQKDKELLSLLPSLERLTHVDDVRSVIASQFHLGKLDADT